MRQLLKNSLVLLSTFALIVAFQNCSKDSFQSRLPSKLDQAANDQLDLPSDDFADEDILGRDDIFNIPPNDNAPSASSESVAEEGPSILAAAATTSGRVFYVATNGSDTNAGTISKPFKTVQRAIKVPLKPGDTVLIRKGRHAPFDLVDINGTAGKRITFKGEPGTIIDRNLAGPKRARNIEISGGSYFTLDGLELTDTDTVRPSIGCVKQTDNSNVRQGIKLNALRNGKRPIHIVIRNMNIHNVRSHAILGSSDYLQFINNQSHNNGGVEKGWTIQAYGTYLKGKGLLIRGNRIYNNNGNGIRVGNDTLGDTEGKDQLRDSIIENNIIYNNGGRFTHVNGITKKCRVSDVPLGDGIVVWHGSGNIIRNNLVWDSKGHGIRIGENLSHGKTPNAVYNNTVYRNRLDGLATYRKDNKDGSIFKNNISYLNSRKSISVSLIAIQSNNLTTDPRFVNPASGDFRLRLGSPAINKGATLKEVLTDFYGVKRPQGGAYDIGAIEFK